MVSGVYAPAKLRAKRTCDEYVIIQSQKNLSRNIIVRSAAYDAVYRSVVVPAQELKDMQQDIDNQKKLKITKQMNPLETRMNPDSSSGIYVCAEARAHSRIVENNRKKAAEDKLRKKAASEKRNSTARDNRANAFKRICETVAKNHALPLEQALAKYKPASDFALALAHLGTKPSSLVNGKKATVIAALPHNHPNCFSADAPPISEQMSSYDASDDNYSDIELAAV